MIKKVLSEMILYFGNDIKRINHALKVYGYACAIMGNQAIDREKVKIIELAAILHDIGIKEAEKKHGSSNGKYQEREGPPIARNILESAGEAEKIINRVCFLIGNHHSYNKIDDIDFQILVEADFLVNIHEGGLGNDSIQSISDRYFKTGAGKKILNKIYQD